MKILNVSPYNFVKGGSDAYFLAQNKLLRKYGVDVAEFCVQNQRNEPSLLDYTYPRGVNLDRPRVTDVLRFIYSIDAKAAIRSAIQEFRPDLVHLHIYYGNFTTSILDVIGKEFGIPVVQTVHDYKLVCPVYSLTRSGRICEKCRVGSFGHALVHRCNRKSILRSAVSVVESYVSYWGGNIDKIDIFIAVSSFQAERLVALGVPEKKIRVLHNFMDAERFEVRIGVPAKKRFLYFGRIEESKGVFDILKAAGALPDYEFLFAGAGSAYDKLRSTAESAGLRNVKVLGFVGGAALHDLVRSCTATILVPFVYENCPMSVLESFALGVPVIGSNMGGIPELVTDGEDGLITAPGELEELVHALRMLGEDDVLAQRYGTAGRHKVETVFSGDVHYTGLSGIYREASLKGV